MKAYLKRLLPVVILVCGLVLLLVYTIGRTHVMGF